MDDRITDMGSMIFGKLTDTELVSAYSDLLRELKRRRIIRSNNVVGDLGEYTAIAYYKSKSKLPKLAEALSGNKGFDATDEMGRRYSIKTVTGRTTGSFFGLPPPELAQNIEPIFDYVILVKFDSNFVLEFIKELTWQQFLDFKRWIDRQRAYNLLITKNLLNNARSIYPD
jgi:hypothetical protein